MSTDCSVFVDIIQSVAKVVFGCLITLTPVNFTLITFRTMSVYVYTTHTGSTVSHHVHSHAVNKSFIITLTRSTTSTLTPVQSVQRCHGREKTHVVRQCCRRAAHEVLHSAHSGVRCSGRTNPRGSSGCCRFSSSPTL